MKQNSREQKHSIINRYITDGESVSVIAKETGIPRSTIYSWIKQYQEEKDNGKTEITVRNFHLLENKVKRLEGIIEIMKKSGCSANDPLSLKLPALEALKGQYNVHMLCEAWTFLVVHITITFFATSVRILGMQNVEKNYE